MGTDSCIAETCLKHSQVTNVRPGLPSVLTGTTEHKTTSLNCTMPVMHAGTLAARPLTVLGAIPAIETEDGSTAAWQSVKNLNPGQGLFMENVSGFRCMCYGYLFTKSFGRV